MGGAEEKLFTLAMDKVSGELHDPASLLLTGKYFGGGGLFLEFGGWLQSRSWCFGEQKNLLLCRSFEL